MAEHAGERAEALVEELRGFRSRSAAAKALARLGPQAVPALVHALKRDDLRPARWAILHCLGQIGAAQAVPAVAAFLADPDYQIVAHEALTRIVGSDLGSVPADWIRWAEDHGAAAAPAPGSAVADDAALVAAALEGTKARTQATEPGRHELQVPLGGGRWGQVSVVFGVEDHEGAPIVIVFADCGPAAPEHYGKALRQNLRMPYGALALRDVGAGCGFVLFNTILRQGLTPVELRKSILAIGERADWVGRQFAN